MEKEKSYLFNRVKHKIIDVLGKKLLMDENYPSNNGVKLHPLISHR